MEPKKNPKADVHSIRGVIFNLSLVISLLTVICAFQWTVPYDHGPVVPPMDEPDELIPSIPITDFNTPVEKPKPMQIEKPVVAIAAPSTIIETDNAPESPTPDPVLNAGTMSNFPPLTVEIEPEVDYTEYRRVEKMPEPVGGLEGFYKEMQKNLKYPRRAVQSQTEGKVFVEFTVEPDGKLSNIIVLTGIGKGCDEEAMRVIGLSKWKPGKQRGKPVRVRMVQPIFFRLGQ